MILTIEEGKMVLLLICVHMRNNQVESLEDLQKTFVEMFGDDLREFMEKQDQTGRKRARVSAEKPNMSRSRACR